MEDHTSVVAADILVEEKEEVMVRPSAGNPSTRNAHFLKPIFTEDHLHLPRPFSTHLPLVSCGHEKLLATVEDYDEEDGLTIAQFTSRLRNADIPQSPVQVSVGTKRRPGRPPKIHSNGGVPANVGVPSSITVTGPPDQVSVGTKRRPGRPPKIHSNGGVLASVSGPSIIVTGPPDQISVGTKRRPGRPPKNQSNGGGPVKKPILVGNGGGVKKGRGRPPKMRLVGLVMGQSMCKDAVVGNANTEPAKDEVIRANCPEYKIIKSSHETTSELPQLGFKSRILRLETIVDIIKKNAATSRGNLET